MVQTLPGLFLHNSPSCIAAALRRELLLEASNKPASRSIRTSADITLTGKILTYGLLRKQDHWDFFYNLKSLYASARQIGVEFGSNLLCKRQVVKGRRNRLNKLKELICVSLFTWRDPNLGIHSHAARVRECKLEIPSWRGGAISCVAIICEPSSTYFYEQCDTIVRWLSKYSSKCLGRCIDNTGELKKK